MEDKRPTIPGAPWKWLYREGTWLGKLAFAASVIFIVCILVGCQSTPCTTCIGPYDITLNSHREALQ